MQDGQEPFAAPIVDLIQNLAVPFRDLGRSHDVDIRGILDAASGITWRFIQVDDDSVARMLRVQLSMGCPRQADVGTYCPKMQTTSEWLNAINL